MTDFGTSVFQTQTAALSVNQQRQLRAIDEADANQKAVAAEKKNNNIIDSGKKKKKFSLSVFYNHFDRTDPPSPIAASDEEEEEEASDNEEEEEEEKEEEEEEEDDDDDEPKEEKKRKRTDAPAQSAKKQKSATSTGYDLSNRNKESSKTKKKAAAVPLLTKDEKKCLLNKLVEQYCASVVAKKSWKKALMKTASMDAEELLLIACEAQDLWQCLKFPTSKALIAGDHPLHGCPKTCTTVPLVWKWLQEHNENISKVLDCLYCQLCQPHLAIDGLKTHAGDSDAEEDDQLADFHLG